jgi:UPF0755 protein
MNKILLYFYLAILVCNASASTPTFIVPVRSHIIDVTTRLTNDQIIDNPWYFCVLGLCTLGQTIEPGIYHVTKNMPISECVQCFKKKKKYKITIIEGWTVADVINALKHTPALKGAIFTVPSEGMILPETYVFSFGDTREHILKRLESSMEKELTTFWRKNFPHKSLLKSPKDLLTLASIIEKETAVSDERPHVASVFINRLKKGMRLQSDPTTIYGITGGIKRFNRSLTKSDLKHASPYNTYMRHGLPPSPIACPGKASLHAAVEPHDTTDLYFVADGTGGHKFSDTLTAHNKNVHDWRTLKKN